MSFVMLIVLLSHWFGCCDISLDVRCDVIHDIISDDVGCDVVMSFVMLLFCS